MIKRILIALLAIILLVGALAAVKTLQIRRMIALGKIAVPPPETVTTVVARSEAWEARLTSVGTLVAVQGVTVTAELSGKVVKIAFEPGTRVQAGDLLLQQDTSSEEAQARSAEAAVTLAKLDIERATRLLSQKTLSQAEYDNANAKYKEAVAQRDNIRATIAKKNIRAPFAGHLGIRRVNIGEIIKDGDPIVSLQAFDPIFANFQLPQQHLAQLEKGLLVRVTSDAFTGQTVEGKISTISPQVNETTRNVEIQATLANPDERLRPGMFVNVSVILPPRENVVAIPATAVLYAPYSDSVFVVEDAKPQPGAQPGKVLRQQIVRLGEKRGDYVVVTSGLQGAETIVSTGVFKLRNAQSVVEDNALAPDFKTNPTPEDR